MSSALIYLGSIVITLWGVGHLVATKSVVGGFGTLSDDNRRIITMEWILEGLTLCFLGILPSLLVATGYSLTDAGEVVIYACAGMLIIMAVVSALTGARTNILPMKACPFVKTSAAILYVAGVLLG